MKKFLLSALSVVTVAALAITGTIAWLQDEDSDVNVMTTGNVYIEQHEYEREVDANGDYKTKDGSYVLTDFKQGKPLLPATSLNADGTVNNFGAGGWDDTKVKMTQVDSYGTMDVFKNANAQDKFVTVENTGKTDAYVRTLIAFELGDVAAADYEKYVRNSTRSTDEADNFDQPWFRNDIGVIKVDGNNYVLVEYIYHGAKLGDGSFRHENGVLPAGDTSYPSLCQVYMTAAATNEIVDALDGNNNGTYDILVVSQAVQAAGFDNAETALNAGFGDITTTNHPWTDGVSIPVTVATADELSAALAAGGNIVVADDVNLSQRTKISNAATIDLAGNTLTAEKVDGFDDVLYVRTADGVTLKNGTVKAENGYAVTVGHSGKTITGVLTIESGTYIGQSTVVQLGYGELIIKGGYFEAKPYNDSYEFTINCMDTSYNNGTAKVTIIGGTFFNFNPADNASEGAGTNYVPDGYKVISEQDSNGNTLYTVVAE